MWRQEIYRRTNENRYEKEGVCSIIKYHKPIPLNDWQLDPRLREIAWSGQLTNGKYVREIEAFVRELYDIKHAICCSSGTQGLLIATQVIKHESGFSSVFTPAFGWYSSHWVIEASGLYPTWSDIDLHTWLMENDKAHCLEMPIHTFGSIYESEADYVIYDGAHAFGSPISEFGTFTVFSLAPTKLITACEGGIICTDSDHLAAQASYMRDKISRMSELNAVYGLRTLEFMPQVLEWKKTIYEYYKTHLEGTFQTIPKGSNYNTIGFLSQLKMPSHIETRQYYEPLIKGLPHTDFVYNNIICLPSWFGVDYKDITEQILNYNTLYKIEEKVATYPYWT